MYDEHDYVPEVLYERALEAVATGATKSETRKWLAANVRGATAEEIEDAMKDAYTEVRGIVDDEDIDPSWRRG